MRRILSASLASALIIAGSTAGFADSPRHHRHDNGRDNYVQNYCDSHGWDRGCRDWRNHHDRWDESHYHDWYRNHHRGPANAAAALFGFAAGAIAGAAANAAADNSHVSRCEDQYRSYDARTDTYLGYDGRRHTCTL